MGLLKKVVVGLIVVVLVGVALYEITKPSFGFEVKSIEIVDRDGYPSVKIRFETNKYPVSFYLLSSEGEKIDNKTIFEPEKWFTCIYCLLSSLVRGCIPTSLEKSHIQ